MQGQNYPYDFVRASNNLTNLHYKYYKNLEDS